MILIKLYIEDLARDSCNWDFTKCQGNKRSKRFREHQGPQLSTWRNYKQLLWELRSPIRGCVLISNLLCTQKQLQKNPYLWNLNSLQNILITIIAWLRSKWKYEALKWVILIVRNFPFWSFAYKEVNPYGLKNTMRIGKVLRMVIHFFNVNDIQTIGQAPPTQLRWQNQALLKSGIAKIQAAYTTVVQSPSIYQFYGYKLKSFLFFFFFNTKVCI